MSLAEEVALLRKIPLFAKLDPAKLKLLAFTSERITYAADQVLFRQGDSGDAAYIIIEGEAGQPYRPAARSSAARTASAVRISGNGSPSGAAAP